MNEKEKQISMQMAFVATALSSMATLFCLGLMAYVVWPIDVIPDFIPVAGQADDAGAIGMAAALMYGLQKSGILPVAMAVLREATKDVSTTVEKAIDEVTK